MEKTENYCILMNWGSSHCLQKIPLLDPKARSTTVLLSDGGMIPSCTRGFMHWSWDVESRKQGTSQGAAGSTLHSLGQPGHPQVGLDASYSWPFLLHFDLIF